MVPSNNKDITHKIYQLNPPEFDTTINSTARLDIDILLHGETGTGKDTLAESIHSLSGRRGKFIALNCAAIPEGLAESNCLVLLMGRLPEPSNLGRGSLKPLTWVRYISTK